MNLLLGHELERHCKRLVESPLTYIAFLPEGHWAKNHGGSFSAIHPRARDYLNQAPILRQYLNIKDYEGVYRFATFCELGINLRDVMSYYDIPYPLRKLTAWGICRPAMVREVFKHVNPSLLSQSIPSSHFNQENWLLNIRYWQMPLHREWVVKWAAHFAPNELRAVYDFAFANQDTFNPRWTATQALYATQEWHRRLAKQRVNDTVIDYTPFPESATINGWEITALRSAQALQAEGAEMHNCVLSRYDNVVKGLSRIYSMQHPELGRATAEFSRYSYAQSKWFAGEIKGPLNRVPPAGAKAAFDIFLSQIRAKEGI